MWGGAGGPARGPKEAGKRGRPRIHADCHRSLRIVRDHLCPSVAQSSDDGGIGENRRMPRKNSLIHQSNSVDIRCGVVSGDRRGGRTAWTTASVLRGCSLACFQYPSPLRERGSRPCAATLFRHGGSSTPKGARDRILGCAASSSASLPDCWGALDPIGPQNMGRWDGMMAGSQWVVLSPNCFSGPLRHGLWRKRSRGQSADQRAMISTRDQEPW